MGRRRRKGLDPSSLWVMDKPSGMSSRDALNRLQRRLGLRSLGHAGTLDPLATGLLLCLSGRFRRLQSLFMGGTKVYEAELRLGARSRTHDAEGPIEASDSASVSFTDSELQVALEEFVGEIDQLPPAFSAVHVDGKRAWKLAREGKSVKLEARRIRVDAVELLANSGADLRLRIRCGQGTYIRSIARDLGERLGCGAYLSGLRRISSGRFDVSLGAGPEELEMGDALGLDAVLSAWPRIDVDEEQALFLSQGASIPCELPGDEAPLSFAWSGGRPLCRLRFLEDDRIRSDLLLSSD